MRLLLLLVFILSALSGQTQTNLKVNGEKDKQFALQELSKKYPAYSQIAKQIWGYAELGFQENKSTTLLQETLRNEGFAIQSGIAEMPTAFLASFGSGKPVI